MLNLSLLHLKEEQCGSVMRLVIEEECSLCGVTYPGFSLHRCFRCGRLYCSNCILRDEEGKPICLKCAKRRVSPKAAWRSKYAYLREYLTRRAKYSSYARLSFKKIEEIMSDRLPPSAFKNPRWWSNTRGQSHSDAWLSVDWRVEKVNLDEKEVIFKKVLPTQTKRSKRKRRKPVSAAFKALALKPKRRSRRSPSRSRIAEAQARIKNIERKIDDQRRFRRFKPKSAYEKRLYKSDKRPE